MNDTEAMVPEWSPDCLDYIAEVVRATGRDFSTPGEFGNDSACDNYGDDE